MRNTHYWVGVNAEKWFDELGKSFILRHISKEADWLLAVNRGRTLRQRPPNPFDSFRREVLETIRGRDLREARRQVLEHLNTFKINPMLVVALQKWLNDEALVREHHLGIVEQ